MQPVNKYMLAVSVLWSGFALFAVALFLPPLTRRVRAWELRHKPASRLPNFPQRSVFLLLTLLMMTVSFATAFHRDLRSTIGINSSEAWKLMMILTALYFALGWRKRKNG
jgi:drug/metabolite transporter (DMT)-like permease